MIPLLFYLFWAGPRMSYLRYLTFKSLRHFHPNSEIHLYISDNYNKTIHTWGVEKQDFEIECNDKNYTEKLNDLGILVHKLEYIGNPDFCAILQADIARWLMLQKGGFYLDTDQIILKPFDSLPLDKDFIYTRYIEKQCGDYLPTGVLGVAEGSEIPKIALQEVLGRYRANDYNSSGPWAMREIIKKINLTNAFNAPYNYFYPVNSSADVWRIYNGAIVLPEDAYALHWYGGSPASQEFNKNYSEEFSKTSKDIISRFLRNNGVV